MRRADQTDRDGIDNGAAATRNHLIEFAAIPGRARDIDEGAALRRGFELAFARRHESRRQLRDIAQEEGLDPKFLNFITAGDEDAIRSQIADLLNVLSEGGSTPKKTPKPARRSSKTPAW